jgi:hypothetical protein
MVYQIELLINELKKNINERITNLINHEYIERSFLFNKIVMQIFYIYL